MTWEDVYKGALLGNLVVTIALAFLHLWLRDKFVPRKEHEAALKLSDERWRAQATLNQALQQRLAVQEEQLRHLPSHDDFKQLTEAVSGVKAEQASQGATLSAVKASAARIEDYLLKGQRL